MVVGDSAQAVDAEAVFEVSSGLTYEESCHTLEHFGTTVIAPARYPSEIHIDWDEKTGGNGTYWAPGVNWHWEASDEIYSWPGGRYPALGIGTDYSRITGATNAAGAPSTPGSWEHCDDSYSSPDGVIDWSGTDNAEIAFVTGGAPNETGDGLFFLTASVSKSLEPLPIARPGYYYSYPPEQIRIGGMGKLDTNGYLAVTLPLHSQVPATAHVETKQYQFDVQGQRYQLIPQCVALVPTNRARTTIGVGEQVKVFLSPALPWPAYSNVNWTTTAGSVSPKVGNWTTLTAPSNAASATVTMHYRSAAFPINFTVLEPKGIDHADLLYPLTTTYGVGQSGAGMHLAVYLAPTNVSFYRVQCMEVGQDASGVKDYYTNYMNSPNWPTNLSHKTYGADKPIPVGYDNSWGGGWDNAGWGYDPSPWSPGGAFTWVIPGKWCIPGAPTTNDITFSDQTFSLTADGTMTVQKFGHTVTRKTNGQYTTVK